MKKYEIDALINEQQTIILDREGKLTSTDYSGYCVGGEDPTVF